MWLLDGCHPIVILSSMFHPCLWMRAWYGYPLHKCCVFRNILLLRKKQTVRKLQKLCGDIVSCQNYDYIHGVKDGVSTHMKWITHKSHWHMETRLMGGTHIMPLPVSQISVTPGSWTKIINLLYVQSLAVIEIRGAVFMQLYINSLVPSN